MIFGKTKMELKVGAFTFAAILILVVFVLSIGGMKTWSSGYRVHFIFKFINGVKLGAPVRFAGVDVGQVKDIKFILPGQDPDTRVDVVCWIKKEIKVPEDSSIWVNTLGLLGEKYIEIMPGKDYSKCLADNQQMAGKDPLPMQEVTDLAKKIASDADRILVGINNQEGTIGKLIYNDDIYKELDAMVSDLRKHPWKLFWKTK